MRDSTLAPGGCDNAGEVGGLPAVVCPAIEPDTYSVELAGGWNTLAAQEFLPMPFLVLAASVEAITPAPPLPLLSAVDLSIPMTPIVGVPTSGQVPTEYQWQEATPLADNPYIGLMMPLEYIPPAISPGEGAWLRFRQVDGNGCTSAVIAFIEAFPGSDADEVTIHVSQDNGVSFVTLTIEPAPAPNEEGPQITYTVEDLVPTCPAPQKAVAVAPACGFPVQVTEFNLEGSMPVVVNGSVTSDIAPGTNELGAGAGREILTTGQSATITSPPAYVLIFSVTGADVPELLETFLRIGEAPGAQFGARVSAADGVVVLTAPPGMKFPALDHYCSVDGAETGSVVFNVQWFV